MKSINTLIKIHTRDLDDLRKSVVKCEEEKEQLIGYNNKMEDELLIEHALAAKNHELGIIFTNYRRLIRDRQAVITKSLQDLDRRIETLKENIALKFGEVKRYEILLANKLHAETKKQQALETKQLDEISINNYLKENAEN